MWILDWVRRERIRTRDRYLIVVLLRMSAELFGFTTRPIKGVKNLESKPS
jgi:hypothetical protein